MPLIMSFSIPEDTYLLIFFNIAKNPNIITTFAQILRNVGLFDSVSAGISGGFC